jgi:tetratricopeptide (TPR) repeat protein
MKNFLRYFLVITVAAIAAAGQSTTPAPSGATTAQPAPRKVDRAAAYYHYSVAHMYEEQVTVYGRSELANKAMEEYRLAIEADPSSEFLTSGLAELYVKTGRIRDAVIEAQDIIKRDPTNLEAHKLLGRIYLRSLGDMPGGSGSDNVLKLAIEQYEQIVKIEPTSVDDHLLLGRLYRLNNDLQKAESELKTAIKLDPNSEKPPRHDRRGRRHGGGRPHPHGSRIAAHVTLSASGEFRDQHITSRPLMIKPRDLRPPAMGLRS